MHSPCNFANSKTVNHIEGKKKNRVYWKKILTPQPILFYLVSTAEDNDCSSLKRGILFGSHNYKDESIKFLLLSQIPLCL